MECPLLHGNMKKETKDRMTQRQTHVFNETLGGFVIALINNYFIDDSIL